MTRASRALSADHDEEAAFAVAVAQRRQLAQRRGSARCPRSRGREQLLVLAQHRARRRLRNRVDELEAVLVHPAQHLVERVAGLVRVAVLILEPGLALAVGADACRSAGRASGPSTPVQRNSARRA